MKKLVSVIVPTWNNPQFLTPCINSIIRTDLLSGLGEIIIVNNGKQPIRQEFGHIKGITILEPEDNLGLGRWPGTWPKALADRLRVFPER
jgi:glycosyltransferase involved in cell wall biosynthesis